MKNLDKQIQESLEKDEIPHQNLLTTYKKEIDNIIVNQVNL
jgi:hypothetical protein